MFFSEAGARPRTWEASPSEHKKWVKVFKACDEDNKGYLSREDFKVAVVMLFGYKPTKIEADSVMSSVNPNTSGLSLEEFLSIVRKKKEVQLHRNEIRHIFTAFDRHYRGYLTLEDFKKAFRQVAPKLSERTILEVFSLHPGDHALPGTSFSTGFKKKEERKLKFSKQECLSLSAPSAFLLYVVHKDHGDEEAGDPTTHH
ncbi:EF-hand calcium-binding domain-containing protein 11 isoform X1 [Panthera leo]|uniref:EF-hand calcium-binding domain-containing protein 11 isoform X1 n=1 Tax=Panthera leo TaxID=9689 RepID=UPI001C6A2460|nr:EF-hand calcium-binding domain-containing protein 11 isoform X1 [Panthera leo]